MKRSRYFTLPGLIFLLFLSVSPIGAAEDFPDVVRESLPEKKAPAAAATPAAVPVPTRKDTLPDEIEKILSGRETLPSVSDEELKDTLRSDVRKVETWFVRERRALNLFLVGSAGSILVGVLLSLGIRRLTRRPDRERWPLRRELPAALASPLIFLLVTVAVFGFMLPLLHSLPDLYPWDARLFFTIMTLIVAWAGFELITVFDRRLLDFARRPDNSLDALMVEITRKFLKITLGGLTLLFIGQSIFDLNITTLLAGAGVVGLAVAFASRETLANFFGTMVIILDRPFRCGDRIQLGGIDGIVESVGMRSTRIRTDSESVYTIPNSTIASANIENISARGVIRYCMTLGLTYDTTAEEMETAMKIVHEVVDNFHGPDPEEYRPRVFFRSFGESALNLQLIMWFKTDNFEVEETWRTEIHLTLLRRFNEAGLDLAYNTVTNLVSGSLTVTAPAAAAAANHP